jgi:transcription initiation factor IIE alpha subunit
MSGSTWKVQPVYATVIEILVEKGSMTDTELFETLKAFYKEIGFDDLNKALMNMEVTGLISVSSLTKDRRLVQLKKK